MLERYAPDAADSLTAYKAFLDSHASRPTNKIATRHRSGIDDLGFRGWYMADFQPPPGAILDVGGYIGATARHYARQGWRVTSIEGAQAYADEWEKNLAGVGGVRLFRGLVEEFDERAAYESCSCTEILNHVVDPMRVLLVAHAALKPGGLLFVTVPAKKQRVEARTFSQESLALLVQEAGFTADTYTWDDGEHMPQIIARGTRHGE